MNPNAFGTFIQSRRKALGMKQSDLAMKLNVTDKAISRWERGIGFPDIKLLEPLADALNLTLTELMHAQVMENPPETLAAETADIIQKQQKISWQRKLILAIGRTVMAFAALFLFWVSRNTPWEPAWLGNIVYGIALVGLFFGSRMLEYIVSQLYLQEKPFGIWHSPHTWVWAGLAFLGLRIAAEAFRYDTLGYVCSLILGFILVIAALLYYAQHEHGE